MFNTAVRMIAQQDTRECYAERCEESGVLCSFSHNKAKNLRTSISTTKLGNPATEFQGSLSHTILLIATLRTPKTRNSTESLNDIT